MNSPIDIRQHRLQQAAAAAAELRVLLDEPFPTDWYVDAEAGTPILLDADERRLDRLFGLFGLKFDREQSFHDLVSLRTRLLGHFGATIAVLLRQPDSRKYLLGQHTADEWQYLDAVMAGRRAEATRLAAALGLSAARQ